MTSPRDHGFDFDPTDWVVGSPIDNDMFGQLSPLQLHNPPVNTSVFPFDRISLQNLMSGRYSPLTMNAFAPAGPRPAPDSYARESNHFGASSIEHLALPQPLAIDSFESMTAGMPPRYTHPSSQFNEDSIFHHAANFNGPHRRQSTKLRSRAVLIHDSYDQLMGTPSFQINDGNSPADFGLAQPPFSTPQQSHKGMDHSNPYLAAYAFGSTSYNELSPVESTVSLTPSVSSVPSTQASFFSATQSFHRISLDQPPGHSKRPLMDSYHRGKPSLDAQQPTSLSYTSGRRTSTTNHAPQGTYSSFTNSLTSMIPFINDRNQRSPPLMSQSPQSPQRDPQRDPQNGTYHLPQTNEFMFESRTSAKELHNRNYIRNMFKSSAQAAGKNGADQTPQVKQENIAEEFDFSSVAPPIAEDDLDLAIPDATNRKQRRRKRSLFTRFVPGSTRTELASEDELDQSQATDEKFVASMMYTEPETAEAGSVNSKVSSGPSSAASQQPGLYEGSRSSEIYDEKSSHGHDYTALFKNVGKRSKCLVKPSTYLKTKKLKEEAAETGVASLDSHRHEAHPSTIVKNEDTEYGLSASLYDGASTGSSFSGYSGARSLDNQRDETGNDNGDAHALRMPLKRVLGSRLMHEKEHWNGNGTIPDSVSQVPLQVDLESLGLPPDTQVYPLSVVAARCKTRGRKQDKEADKTDETKIFLCSYCPRRFKRQEHLKRHFRSLHTFEKPYNCEICNKSFSRTDNLNQHMKTHTQREIEDQKDVHMSETETSSILE